MREAPVTGNTRKDRRILQIIGGRGAVEVVALGVGENGIRRNKITCPTRDNHAGARIEGNEVALVRRVQADVVTAGVAVQQDTGSSVTQRANAVGLRTDQDIVQIVAPGIVNE